MDINDDRISDADIETEKERPFDNKACNLFDSKKLRGVKIVLRMSSLWHPKNACFAEKVLHPLLVNILLLSILVSDVLFLVIGITKGTVNRLIFLGYVGAIFVSSQMWLGHIFAIIYFKKRDFENNLLATELDDGLRKALLKIVRKSSIIMCILFFGFGIFFVTFGVISERVIAVHSKVWKAPILNETSKNPVKEDLIDIQTFLSARKHMDAIGYLLNLYSVPISLCLTVTIYLLYHTSRVRLEQMKRDFLKWDQSAEDAIFYHDQTYSRKIRSSCSALQLLFVSHNIMYAVSIPVFTFICADIATLKQHKSLPLPLFILLCIFVSWMITLYFAECIRSSELKFLDNMNRYCQGFKDNKSIEGSEYEDQNWVFSSRDEVYKVVTYLRERKSGFWIGGYSVQLQISMASSYLSLVVLIVKLLI